MDLFRAGEALLRHPHPILPFLAPSARSSTITRRITSEPPLNRTFALSSPHRAEQNPVDSFSDLLNRGLDKSKGTPTAPTGRTTRYASPSAQQANRLSPSARLANTQSSRDTSMDEILGDLRLGRPSARQSNISVANALDVHGLARAPAVPAPVPEPPVKLGSSVGRTIAVNDERGMDVGRAFRTLEMRCAQNSVKRDFMRQRYHERPGLKRKRLKSERWRRNFKQAFRGTIKMVQGLKKQGW